MELRYAILGEMARCLPIAPSGSTLLVSSPGHLGDILQSIPMLKALREGCPSLKIIWLVGPWSKELAERYKAYVDEIRILGPNLPPYTRGRSEWRQGVVRQWEEVVGLRREKIETLIAPADGFGRYLANAVCPRLWVGIGEWRSPRIRASIETVFLPYEKDRYEADALCRCLKPLGIDAHADRLEYAVTEEERLAAGRFWAAQRMDSLKPLALIAPGSGWPGKNWMPERFGELAEWLSDGKRYQVAWVGGRGEEPLVPSQRHADANWVGKTSLPLMAALMERASLFVGNDGGAMHFAAALDVPTVTAWGPTNPGKWGPKGSIHRQVRRMERCAGCVYWDWRASCRHDRACMTAIRVAEMKAAVEFVLEAGRTHGARCVK